MRSEGASDFTVTVHGQRAETFKAVFGTPTVHVDSPVPRLARLPGFVEPVRVYKLDFDALDGDQYARLVRFLAEQFDVDEEAVGRELAVHGLPILASDCTVTIHNPQRWID